MLLRPEHKRGGGAAVDRFAAAQLFYDGRQQPVIAIISLPNSASALTPKVLTMQAMHHPGASLSCIRCRVEPPGQNATCVIRDCDPRGGIWMPPMQVFELCIPYQRQSTQRRLSAFQRLCNHSAGSRILTGPDRQQMVIRGQHSRTAAPSAFSSCICS